MNERLREVPRRVERCAIWLFSVLVLASPGAEVLAGAYRTLGVEGVARPYGTFVQSLGGRPTSLDPAKTNRVHDDQVIWLLYDALLQYSHDAKALRPALAERWEQSPDGLITTFFLRKNVRFHDGTVLDAEAVKATYERQYLRTSPFYTATPANAYERILAGLVKEIRIVDSHTVTLATHYPRPHQFAIVKIVSPNALRANQGNLTRAPTGTGAFRLTSWEVDEITLAPFAESWHGRPQVSGLSFRIMASDIDEMEALAAGQLDLAVNINPDSREWLASNVNVDLVTFGCLNTMFLGMLLDRPIMKDRRVREAVVRAVDRDRIASNVGRGTATAGQGVLPPQRLRFDTAAAQPAYDPDRARALLKEIGAASPLDLRLLHFNPSQLWAEVAHAVRSDLEKAGPRVEMINTESRKDFHAQRQKGQHDLHLSHWNISAPDRERFLAPMFGAKSPNNCSRFVTPDVDRLFAEARRPMDPARRLGLFEKAHRLVLDENPAVCLMHRVGIAGVNKRVHGLTLNLYGLPQDKLVNVQLR